MTEEERELVKFSFMEESQRNRDLRMIRIAVVIICASSLLLGLACQMLR